MSISRKTAKPLTVAFAVSEAAPFAKTGGLADVGGALPHALAELGHDVHLFMPLYRQVDRRAAGVTSKGIPLNVPISARVPSGKAYTVRRNGLTVHFIEQAAYFDRDHLYNTPGGDYADNCERFVFFCRGVLEALRALKIRPDVIHAHDWQTALIPVYLKTLYKDDPVVGGVPSVFTIHNLGFQGVFWHLDWHLTGLPWGLYTSGALEFYGKINLMKGALLFSDIISTVSGTYASEIKTREHGWGLEGVLKDRSADLYGVLNGIDTDAWNPATDQLIPANFSVRNLEGKKKCKQALMAEMGFNPCEAPVIGVVSRLVEQKGMDILAEMADGLLDNDVRLVALGTGSPRFEEFFRGLAARRPDRAACIVGYDETLAHRIEAGADIFLMPSRYEPCGLNQLYSLRYGTAPVVRATGGLNDTIREFNPATGDGNGFKFHEPTPHALYWKTVEAITLLKNRPGEWEKMIRQGMKEDHSWSKSARSYQSLYRQARARAGGGFNL
ncbi:MAG: glycogen synthase GlgA [Nitrospinae bacterium]|nr:glycogen synthase GlgA [Nitrospinota bacterium]